MTALMERHRAPDRGPVARVRELVVRPRIGLVVIGLVILGIVGWSIVGRVQAVEQEAEAVVVEEALAEVADPLAALCAENPAIRARVGPACDTASQVASAPPDMPVDGLDGRPGMDGRGIRSTLLRADGHLVLTYDDGTMQDVGLVVGEGGAEGVQGVGITSAATEDGRLILTFSDGAVVDVGRIVGERGRGVQSTAVVDGRLIVSYDDGTTQDAGALPPGPPGEPAELPAQVIRSYPDGTSETCVRDGGPNTAPVYACGERE